jgi:hypothetical protein
MCISYNTGSFIVSCKLKEREKTLRNPGITGVFFKQPGDFSAPDMML